MRPLWPMAGSALLIGNIALLLVVLGNWYYVTSFPQTLDVFS